MVYFFPLDIARGKKETTIQVSKFHDGKWQSEEFDVRVGEAIGNEVEVEVKDEWVRPDRRKNTEDIKTIDFSSGAILVDIVESRRSVSGGRRPYQEILYSQDGSDIKHLGVSKRNWSKAMSSTFNDIADQDGLDVVISLSRGQSGRRTLPGGRDGGYDDYMEMMEMPGGFRDEFR